MNTNIILSKPIVQLTKPFRRLLTNWPTAVIFRKRVAGRTLYVDLRTSIGREIFLTGAFDPGVFQPLARYLRPGDTFVDVGVNIGYYSLLALEKVGATGQIYGFDIDPRPLQMIRRTIVSNHLDNLHLLAVAIGDHVGQATLKMMPDSGHTYLSNRTTGPQVPMTTLDALSDQGYFPNGVRAMKIDIEGGEYGVLVGARQLIRKYSPMIVFEAQDKFLVRNNANLEQIYQFLRETGYTWELLGDAGSPTIVATPAHRPPVA